MECDHMSNDVVLIDDLVLRIHGPVVNRVILAPELGQKASTAP